MPKERRVLLDDRILKIILKTFKEYEEVCDIDVDNFKT